MSATNVQTKTHPLTRLAQGVIRNCVTVLAATMALMIPATAAPSHVPPVVVSASTTLFSNGTTSIGPGQVAVDKAGNVFYINHTSPYTLYEIPAASPAVTTTTPVALITGLGQYNSNGVFVDPKGNLWVANGNGSATVGSGTEYIGLIEIPANANGIPNTAALTAGGETVAAVAAANCSATQTVPCVWQDYTYASNISGQYMQPSSLFVDASGNVYLVDYYDNTSKGAYNRIVKFNVATPNTGTLLADNLTSNNDATIALDGAGNVYYADSVTGNSKGGSVSLVSAGMLTAVGSTATVTSAVIASATGVAADVYGDIFISSTTQISEVPFEGTALNFADEFGIVNALSNTITYGGFLDTNGNFYYASYTNIQQVQINGYNFGNVAIGSATVTGPSLNVYFNASTVISGNYFPTGSPTSNTYAVYLQSFPYSGTKTCGGGSTNAAGTECAVTMDFQPVHAGLLKGSYAPRDAASNEDVVANLQGVGVGPQLFFLPGVASTLFSAAATSATVSTSVNLNNPTGLAVDTFGDIFVADTGNGRVVADCLASTAVATGNSFCAGASGYPGKIVALGTSFTSPAGVALDGANNLYVVDSTANAVTKIQSDNLVSATLVAATDTFGGTVLSGPMGIATDGYGNVYIADTGNNRIVKAHQYGAAATENVVYVPSTLTFGGTALNRPVGLSVDASGNLFIADRGNNRIVEYSALGVVSVVPTTGITLNAPNGVAALPSGSLLVTDAGNTLSLLNGSTGQAVPLTGFTVNTPQGIALDLAGNVYLSDTAAGRVLELNTNSPASSTFPSTPQTTISAANTITVLNAGTATLTPASAPSLDTGDVNFAIQGASTCGTGALAKNASCTLATVFKPQAVGPLTGSITLADNQLGYTLNTSTFNEQATFSASGTQTIALSGTATSAPGLLPQTITFTAPTTPITFGNPASFTVAATGGASGNPVVFSILSGPATVSGNTVTVTGAGTIVVAADQAGNSTYAQAGEVTRTVVVNQATQTIAFTAPASPVAFSSTPISLSATGGASGNPVVFSVVSGPGTISGNALTTTGVGTIVVAANQAANTNYSAATQVTQSVVVSQATQTISFTAPPSPIVYSSAAIPLSATASSGLGVTFSIVSGPGTISGSSLTLTGVGAVVIAANQAGNANVSAATQVTQSVVVNPIGTVATPVLSLVGGTYNGTQTLLLTDSTPGAVIYYTINGTTPTTSSSTYNPAGTGLSIANSETVEAIAVANGYSSSQVATAAFVISSSAATFSYTLTPATLTLAPGASGTINITLTPNNGFSTVVNFACTGLPTGGACAFSPGTVTTTPAQTPVSTVLTVTAPATTASLHQERHSLATGTVLACMTVLLGFRRRRLRPLLLAVLCIAGLGLFSGCGTSTANRTSQVTVTMAGGSVRQSTTFTLTLQ